MANELYKQSEKDYLDYLMEQFTKGLLDEASCTPLIKAGYIKTTGYVETEVPEKIIIKKDFFEDNYLKYLSFDNNIQKADWIPESIVKHADEFYEWINNVTFGYFTDAITKHIYPKYELYKAQCFKWLQDRKSVV